MFVRWANVYVLLNFTDFILFAYTRIILKKGGGNSVLADFTFRRLKFHFFNLKGIAW